MKSVLRADKIFINLPAEVDSSDVYVEVINVVVNVAEMNKTRSKLKQNSINGKSK